MSNNPFHYYTELTDERLHLNEFASSLRNLADQDYIACRSLFRRDHLVHSAYLAHQSIEKYFKSILLYLGLSTIKFGHDISKLSAFVQLHGVVMDERSLKLIKVLDGLHNVSRYRSGSFFVNRSFIHDLDYFVRDIRPFVHGRFVQKEWMLPHNVYQIMSGHKRNTCRIHMSSHLEKILKSKKLNDKIMRSDLIWNNYYFHERKRHKGRKYLGGYSSNFHFNLDNPKDIEMAKYVSGFFKFESDIDKFLNPKKK